MFQFNYILYIFNSIKGGFAYSPLFPFVPWNAYWSKKKSRLLARYRWWRIRILSLHIEGKVSHTLRSGNQSHWQNIWEKRKILCKVKFHVFGEKSNILFLVIHASTDNIFIVGRKLGIDNNSMEFWDFLKSYVVWQLLSQLVFTILLVIITFYFTCCKRNTS